MSATPSLPPLRLDVHSSLQVVLDFSAPPLSVNGGLPLIRQLDDRLGFLPRLAALLPDPRDPAKIKHSRLEQLRQRVFQILCGYEDQNDASALCREPLLKAACATGPDDAPRLSSQSTVSRFENTFSARVVVTLQHALEDDYVASLPHDTEAIVLDVDTTDVCTFGEQQLAFYNTYYGSDIYFPLLVFDHEGRLVSVRLRAGNVGGNRHARALLVRLIRKLKKRFPALLICVRGDSAFCTPRLLDELEELDEKLGGISYLLGLQKNLVLNKLAKRALKAAEKDYDATMRPARRYLARSYQAETWKKARHVVIKAEYLPEGPNPRFVVANLDSMPPRLLYENGYSHRGEAENRIKDFKVAMAGARLSNMRFVSNALRLLLHAFAYRLMDALRRHVAQESQELGRAQMDTLREKLVKVPVIVVAKGRRLLVSLSRTFPLAEVYHRVAQRVGAVVARNCTSLGHQPSAVASQMAA